MARKPKATGGSPTLKIERWAIERLREDPRNAKKHPPEQVEQLRASIREFGFTVPVLVRPDGLVIAGHGRLEAARLEGLRTLPVIVARGWTDAQCRAYMVLDNKLPENGSWDDQLLAAEIAALRDMDFDIALLGFSPPELNAILDGWKGDLGEVAGHGEHTEGITVTIKVSVAQGDREEAEDVIRNALGAANIDFEL